MTKVARANKVTKMNMLIAMRNFAVATAVNKGTEGYWGEQGALNKLKRLRWIL